MRKIFLVLVGVLLIATTVQAVEMTQAITAEYAAQSKGRAVTSDSSVLIRVWYEGSGASPAVGVSNTSAILLYTDVTAATSTLVSAGTYATIGAMVDFINDQTDWKASVGDDSYRAMVSTILLPENHASPGDREDNAYTVNLDSSLATFMSCGVLSSAGRIGRIKQFDTHVESINQDVDIDIYEGDTSVYHKHVVAANYQSSTAFGSSGDTVVFPGKGLAGSKNTPLCLVVDTVGALDVNAVARARNGVNIIYDKLAE